MEELRKMKALNYEKDENPGIEEKKGGWLYELGAWVRRNDDAVIWAFYISLGVLLLGVLVLFIKKNDIAFRWSSGGGKNYNGLGIRHGRRPAELRWPGPPPSRKAG